MILFNKGLLIFLILLQITPNHGAHYLLVWVFNKEYKAMYKEILCINKLNKQNYINSLIKSNTVFKILNSIIQNT